MPDEEKPTNDLLIGQLMGKLDTFIDHTKETNDLFREGMTRHFADQQAHSGVIPRIESLENTRRWGRRRAAIAAVSVPATGAAVAKLGWLGKVIAAITAASAVSGGPT